MLATSSLALPAMFVLASFGSCDMPDPPEVSVVIEHADIKYDFSKTKRALAAFKIDTVSPYSTQEHAQIGGLMGGRVSVKSDMNISWSSSSLTQTGCYWFKDIKIILETDPTIYIASDYPKNSCQYREIMEHERHHILIDRRLIGEFAKSIEESAHAAAKEIPVIGPVKGAPEDIQKKMAAHIEAAVKEASDKMYAERRKRQQALDSREEYERISRSCP